MPGIDFVRIAEGYGVQATSVSTAKDFVVALEDALAGTRPVVIEVLTAPGRRSGGRRLEVGPVASPTLGYPASSRDPAHDVTATVLRWRRIADGPL